MPVVKELIRSEQDGSLSFGNYQLDTKSKVSDFEHCGDSYKVKTYNDTKYKAYSYDSKAKKAKI